MLKKRLISDSGLMGPTHALSAVAITFLIAWLASDFMFGTLLGSDNFIVFIAAIIIITGSALMPDLDAVKSTSISTLGPVGSILSKLMRTFSSLVQNTIKSKSDSVGADPHRGFWHTIIAGLFAGFLVMTLTKINIDLFSIGELNIRVSDFVVIFILYISLQLFMASLFKSFYKKSKDSLLGQVIMNIASIVASVALVFMIPENLSYNWVGIAVSFGWIAHLIGDMMTVAGVPVLFPLKFKGKRWWNFRFPLGIKAGGWIEMSILMPLFGVIAIVAAIAVIPLLK